MYALGLLDADEADAFERQLDAEADLRRLVRELGEAAALLAFADHESVVTAPPVLRDRVLSQARASQTPTRSRAGTKPVVAPISWLPWAIAALFMGCSGVLLWDRQESFRRAQVKSARSSVDPLAQVSFCVLETTPAFTTAQPRAAVLWDAAHRRGKLRVNRLAPPAAGKDYQLWTVEAARKEAVSAGVLHVDADGTADVPFQPEDGGGNPVVAVAISLEQAGGSPTTQGPILLLGKF